MEKDWKEYLKKRLEEVEESYAKLEKFSDIVTHEIKVPIRAIKTNNDIIKEESWDNLNDESKASIEEIDYFCEMVFSIIEGLLNQAKTKKRQFRFGLVNMNSLVREVFEEIVKLNKLKAKEIELVCYPLPEIVADELSMRRVIYNIFSNSIKFAKKNQQIILTVGSCNTEEENTFYFVDNGIGFDMKYSDKLFEMFNRLHSDTEYEGSGIGLYTVKYIIEKHHGSVFIEAVKGKGCVIGFKMRKNAEPGLTEEGEK